VQHFRIILHIKLHSSDESRVRMHKFAIAIAIEMRMIWMRSNGSNTRDD